MLERGQDVKSVKMNTEIRLLFLGKDPEDLPASGAPIDAAVGKGLCEHDVHDLLAKKQFSALGVSDDIGDRSSRCCPGLHIGALEIVDYREDLALAKGGELRISWRLDWLCDRIRPVGLDLVFA